MAAGSFASAPTGLRRFALVWQVVAVFGLAIFAAHTLLGERVGLDDFFNRYFYNGLILLALGACAARVVRVRAERGAWLLFTIAVASWAVGELLFDFAYGGQPPYPSAADGFYLAFYPACYVAMLMLVRARLSEFSRALWFDGAMAAIASSALGAAVLFEVVLRSTDGSEAVVVTNLSYPIGDILLLSAVAGIYVLTAGRPGRTWALLGASLAATAGADGIFLFETATNSYREGTILDAMWPGAMLLLAASALQTPRRSDVALAGRPLLATPLACGLIGLGIFTYDHFHRLNVLAASLAGATIISVIVRTGMTFRQNSRMLQVVQDHAVTDALTGLGNRRRLVGDVARALEYGIEAEPRVLMIFDLDGFKIYNDVFGHPAGDVLLARLGASLDAAVQSMGTSYRLGGDEFCVLANVPAAEAGAFLDRTVAALSEEGEGFSVTTSFGVVFIPEEAATPSDAMRIADERLYAQKRERARGYPHEVLLQALYERDPDLKLHVQSVADTACVVGRAMGLSGDSLEELGLAARLHDVGKLAIPDAVLQKPGPLDVAEWEFIKEHTLIGERILSASPAWKGVGKIVRATHEHWDGSGYSDGLSGTDIPLAARIIAVCDAFSAMTSSRPYRATATRRHALDELRRCAGAQFDPDVVEAFCAEIERPPSEARSGAEADAA